jgi:DUF2934 family protein
MSQPHRPQPPGLAQLFALVDRIVATQARLVRSYLDAWGPNRGSADATETADDGNRTAVNDRSVPAADEPVDTAADQPLDTAADQPLDTAVVDEPVEPAEEPMDVADDVALDDHEVSDDAIAARAYELYEERGRQPGHEQEDWNRAQRELQQALAQRRGDGP